MRKTRCGKTRIPGLLLLFGVCLVFGASCAKIGEPKPPEIQIPKPASDLTVHQVSNSIVVAFTKPVQNTDGSPARTLATIELFRLVENIAPGIQSHSLPEDQFIRKAAHIRSIASTNFEGFTHGDSFVIEDKPALPDRSSIYSHEFRYAVLFINKKNQTAGFSNQALIRPVAIPLPPQDISARVAEHSIRLSWLEPTENMDGSRPPHFAGFDLLRSSDPQTLSGTPINPAPLTKPEYEDRNFEFGHTYYYAVRTVGSIQDPYAISLWSDIVPVEARDTFPPEPPENFNAIREGGDIILLWIPSASPDVAGYRIHRLNKKTGARILLHKDLITALSFRDGQVESGDQYEYSIQAVDTHGNESVSVRAEIATR
jgi:hypothetical protein